MAEVIRMPRLSDTMEEGTLVKWYKKVGDPIEKGDILGEIETDKATMEWENFHLSGVLLYVGAKEGDAVPVDTILGVIGKAGEDFQVAIDAANGTAPVPVVAAPMAPAPAVAVPIVTDVAPVSVVAPAVPTASTTENRIKASPLAKAIAMKEGVDLTKMQGTGEQGRIVRRDVEASFAAPPAVAVPAPAVVAVATAVAAADGNFTDTPVSQMRKVIARRLGESKFSAPHFYLTVEIDMDNLIATRVKLNEMAAPQKVSFNDLVMKACAASLRQHPAVNSSWLGDKIRQNHDINIAVAVAVEDGLMVPVVRHTDRKSLTDIGTEVRALAQKAKERALQPNEMQGNTFTISNLGMFDIEEFTAIINPPDACILAVGAIVKKPVVRGDQIVVGNTMKVTLSCDHRVVDGATGAQFLQTLKAVLEEPMRLLL